MGRVPQKQRIDPAIPEPGQRVHQLLLPADDLQYVQDKLKIENFPDQSRNLHEYPCVRTGQEHQIPSQLHLVEDLNYRECSPDRDQNQE